MKTEMMSKDLNVIDRLIEECFPFDEFHNGQFEAIRTAVEGFVDGYKHVVIEAPTGVGKSVIAVTVHRVLAKLTAQSAQLPFRTTITTTTKGLQDQYRGDGIIDGDLRSKTNYGCAHGCKMYGTPACRTAVQKKVCNPNRDCEYLMTKRKWLKKDKIRTTNNAMQLEMPGVMCAIPGDTKADMIVIDECHKLDQSLLNHSKIEFSPKRLEPLVRANVQGADVIRNYVEKIYIYFARFREGEIYTVDHNLLNIICDMAGVVEEVKDRMEKFIAAHIEKANEDAAARLMSIMGILHDLQSVSDLMSTHKLTDLIIYECQEGSVILKPIFPRDVSDYSLFSKADIFLHMSATICGMESYLDRLGIERKDAVLHNVANPIPLENRTVNYCPVDRMSGKMDPVKVGELTKQIDGLIEHMHPNDNGLIHTVSYSLAEAIIGASKYASKMVVVKGKDRDKTLELLRKTASIGKGVVVLSPAMEEGYDLKGDLCRFCVVAKVPYEFMGDPLVKLTSTREPDQYFRQAILRIVQACGRGVRGVNDECATYILDESFGSLIGRNEKFFPKWFVDSVKSY